MPLSIPNGPWEQLSMDFITGLPLTSSQNDMIWTIVDRFSKQAYFIPCKKTLSAPQDAKLFIKTIFPSPWFSLKLCFLTVMEDFAIIFGLLSSKL